MEKLLWRIVKTCILWLDRDNTLLAYSFSKDEHTDYHIIAERFFVDRHCFGTTEETYWEEGEQDDSISD